MSSSRITAAYAKLPENIGAICEHVRALIHKAAPSLKESWKWGPCFEGNGIVLGLWGFKKHVSLVFYRGSEMSNKHQLFNDGFDNAHNRMIKFTSLKEVPAKKLSDYIKEAVKVDQSGSKTADAGKRILALPEELSVWLSKNKKAKAFFEALSFTYRREMVQHITGAKQEATRVRRFEQIKKALQSETKTVR